MLRRELLYSDSRLIYCYGVFLWWEKAEKQRGCGKETKKYVVILCNPQNSLIMSTARISKASLRLHMRAVFLAILKKIKYFFLIWLNFRLFFRGGLSERTKIGEVL